MPYTYQQSTGRLMRDGVILAIGYSGNGAGLNNPEAQTQHGVGPLPQGKYKVGAPQMHPKLGPLAMPLTPDPANVMFGRSAFFMHGDNPALDRTASDGCIIQGPAIRALVAKSVGLGDDELTVIA